MRHINIINIAEFSKNNVQFFKEEYMTFRPLHDRIAVKALAQENKTSGGIIIPDTAQEKPMQGEVIAVGSGMRNSNGDIIPLEVKVGDIVVYGKWAGNEIRVNHQDIIIMKESDVMGIIQ
jgi:chaperonin GroES